MVYTQVFLTLPLLHRLAPLLYQLASLLHQLASLLHQLASLLYRLASLLHRLASLLHRLASLLHRLAKNNLPDVTAFPNQMRYIIAPSRRAGRGLGVGNLSTSSL